jgi:hypothetical protein
MGTFEKAYEVDGERLELYCVDGEAYQLVDEENLLIGRPFSGIPDEEVVVGLVRAIKALRDDRDDDPGDTAA